MRHLQSSLANRFEVLNILPKGTVRTATAAQFADWAHPPLITAAAAVGAAIVPALLMVPQRSEQGHSSLERVGWASELWRDAHGSVDTFMERAAGRPAAAAAIAWGKAALAATPPTDPSETP